jgi:anaerobic dimethyl sulfoxide reductase subunit B (iron-sulfur subunit)
MDRLTEGKKPICVEACPTWALDAGPLDELRAKYGDVKNAEGFVYSRDLAPSVTFKPKQDTKGLVVQKILISPPAP